MIRQSIKRCGFGGIRMCKKYRYINIIATVLVVAILGVGHFISSKMKNAQIYIRISSDEGDSSTRIARGYWMTIRGYSP